MNLSKEKRLECFNEGKSAKSIFENPYWKTYPRDSSDDDETMARFWVDGYVERIKNETTA